MLFSSLNGICNFLWQEAPQPNSLFLLACSWCLRGRWTVFLLHMCVAIHCEKCLLCLPCWDVRRGIDLKCHLLPCKTFSGYFTHEVCEPKEEFVIGEQFQYCKSWCLGMDRRIDREVGTCKINVSLCQSKTRTSSGFPECRWLSPM